MIIILRKPNFDVDVQQHLISTIKKKQKTKNQTHNFENEGFGMTGPKGGRAHDQCPPPHTNGILER